MIEKLAPNCKRVIVRAQPFMLEIEKEFIGNISRVKEAGAYGITVEGMKFKRKKPGLVRVGGDFCYPENTLRQSYERIREQCRRDNVAFFCAENRLRKMGDSLCCCGCGDLPGFVGNEFNLSHLLNGHNVEPTERMKMTGTGTCFKGLYQVAGIHAETKQKPFAAHMLERVKRD